MNRVGIIFILLSVYILAAFSWWTYSHYRNAKTMFEQNFEILNNLSYKATFDLHGATDQELYYDSLGMKKYFELHYPQLELSILDPYDPLNNFMVKPSYNSYLFIEAQYKRKVRMYILEGIVMILLLFWGIITIYRSLRKEIGFKKQQTNFLLSITHELKTPITAVRLYLETLKKRKLNEEQTNAVIANSLDEVERLQDQVENLLLSAQLDSKAYQLQFETVNLSELCYEFATNFARPRNLENKLHLNIEEQIILQTDPNALEMIMSNLMSNAVKYGGANTEIWLDLHAKAGEIALCIADNGPGISEHDKKMLFKKFYRSGDENTRKTKGTGLGLFIVRNLVELHKAKIQLHSNSPHGTKFEIKFKSDAE
ncbi:MAG: HAMP domain-containing histidine kinase [Bacteroidetes bacterium]|nr:HAMP domain-containing histidine kinase [Bacteroidota bacterium]